MYPGITPPTERPVMQTLRLGSILVSANDHTVDRNVITTPTELLPDPGMFVMVSYNSYRTFGKLTGRTTQRWGMRVPTIERYEVETVVITEDDGTPAIYGIPGKRIAGTMVTRPENVVAA
jgi:hypothetical protein